MKKIIIIGAGITGLTLYNQLQTDNDVTILEASNRMGGRIHTVKMGYKKKNLLI